MLRILRCENILYVILFNRTCLTKHSNMYMKTIHFEKIMSTLISDFLRFTKLKLDFIIVRNLYIMHHLPVNLHACILYDLTILITFRLSNLDPVDPTRIFIYEHL